MIAASGPYSVAIGLCILALRLPRRMASPTGQTGSQTPIFVFEATRRIQNVSLTQAGEYGRRRP
jgi:hypothetical protein